MIYYDPVGQGIANQTNAIRHKAKGGASLIAEMSRDPTMEMLHNQQQQQTDRTKYQKGLETPTPNPTLSPFYQSLMQPTPMGTPTAPGEATFQNNNMGTGGFGGMGTLGQALSGGGGFGGGGGMGQYTSGITAGNLPDSVVNQASQAIMRPQNSFLPQQFAGTGAGQQIADMASQHQASDNVNMMRGAAQTQAALNMARQGAQANAGLGWSNYLAGMNEDNIRRQNSFLQPIAGSLLSALT